MGKNVIIKNADFSNNSVISNIIWYNQGKVEGVTTWNIRQDTTIYGGVGVKAPLESVNKSVNIIRLYISNPAPDVTLKSSLITNDLYIRYMILGETIQEGDAESQYALSNIFSVNNTELNRGYKDIYLNKTIVIQNNDIIGLAHNANDKSKTSNPSADIFSLPILYADFDGTAYSYRSHNIPLKKETYTTYSFQFGYKE